jgi:hypothetical protein
MNSGFRRDVDGNSVLLCCYAASGGNFLATFWDNLSGTILAPEDGIDSLSRNVGNKLPLLAVQ